MYFSKEQIEQSIRRLNGVNPFFGITFLAFKKERLPVGSTKSIYAIQLLNAFLQKYYRPAPQFENFYSPFEYKEGNHWRSGKSYASALQATAAKQLYQDVLIHPPGSLWGWQVDYINALKKHLEHQLIPTFDLAVWLFRSLSWNEQMKPVDVIETFFTEFLITPGERFLFDQNVPFLTTASLQDHPVHSEEILEIIGPPPGRFTESATLRLLKLRGVGPARGDMEFTPAQRLNLITGDNGLGKSFLLECAWWALTGIWAGYAASARRDVPKDTPSIIFQIGTNRSRQNEQVVKYDWDRLAWLPSTRSDTLAGLSIFARFDGSFTIWDPAKHLLGRDDRYPGNGSDAWITFSRADIWDGVRKKDELTGRTIVLCDGLITDWVRWQESKEKKRFDELEAVLDGLSPGHTDEALKPGEPTKMLDQGERRDIPTLKFPYGEIPILLCSAGIQRIISLAYLLVWAWEEHVSVAQSMQREPERSIVLLIDEIEAHLHPFWQRTIVPSLMNVVQKLAPQVQTQLIMTTHSPLILASVETIFDEDQDTLFHLYQENGVVHLENEPFVKRGRVDKWLMSDAFGLAQPRSLDAEKAIEEAKELQRKRTPSKEEVQRVSAQLIASLADDDDFWPRWTYFAEQRGASL